MLETNSRQCWKPILSIYRSNSVATEGLAVTMFPFRIQRRLRYQRWNWWIVVDIGMTAVVRMQSQIHSKLKFQWRLTICRGWHWFPWDPGVGFHKIWKLVPMKLENWFPWSLRIGFHEAWELVFIVICFELVFIGQNWFSLIFRQKTRFPWWWPRAAWCATKMVRCTSRMWTLGMAALCPLNKSHFWNVFYKIHA